MPRCQAQVQGATASLTALVEVLGYERAQEIATRARSLGKGIREVAVGNGFLSAEEFDRLVSPERVSRLGSPPQEAP